MLARLYKDKNNIVSTSQAYFIRELDDKKRKPGRRYLDAVSPFTVHIVELTIFRANKIAWRLLKLVRKSVRPKSPGVN